MSLVKSRKWWPTRSLYSTVLLVVICILSVAFVIFQGISYRTERLRNRPLFEFYDQMQLETAQSIYQQSGNKALSNYMAELDRYVGGRHYFLDAHGVDVLTGTNRSNLIPAGIGSSRRISTSSKWNIARLSSDGKYWFVGAGTTRRVSPTAFLPFYFLIMGVVTVLFWLAAAGIISPIRNIAATIALFGRGDLSVRVGTRRSDEIGQLGSSFNVMAERLERMIHSERRLLADLSHELRSPLARLKFAIKLARTSGDSTTALDRIERDIDRISSLVGDIVDITLIENDHVLQGGEVVPIAQLVREIVQDCVLEAQVKNCDIFLQAEVSSEVIGSRELMRRAIENVIRNGIRYSPEKTAVNVLISTESHAVKIVVRDFGPGVPAEALTQIFAPFFQIEEARTIGGGGFGLGLSIARRAVLVHDGTIVAENASPGLRVTITLPVLESAVDGETVRDMLPLEA